MAFWSEKNFQVVYEVVADNWLTALIGWLNDVFTYSTKYQWIRKQSPPNYRTDLKRLQFFEADSNDHHSGKYTRCFAYSKFVNLSVADIVSRQYLFSKHTFLPKWHISEILLKLLQFYCFIYLKSEIPRPFVIYVMHAL